MLEKKHRATVSSWEYASRSRIVTIGGIEQSQVSMITIVEGEGGKGG